MLATKRKPATIQQELRRGLTLSSAIYEDNIVCRTTLNNSSKSRLVKLRT